MVVALIVAALLHQAYSELVAHTFLPKYCLECEYVLEEFEVFFFVCVSCWLAALISLPLIELRSNVFKLFRLQSTLLIIHHPCYVLLLAVCACCGFVSLQTHQLLLVQLFLLLLLQGSKIIDIVLTISLSLAYVVGIRKTS